MGNSYNRKFSYPHWDASQHDDLYLTCFENSAEQWRNEVYDIYFAAPFLHRDVTYGDTMGVYASPGQYKNLLKIQEKYNIPISLTLNEMTRPIELIRPDVIKDFVSFVKKYYDDGVRSCTISHTHLMKTGALQSAFPDMDWKNTVNHRVCTTQEFIDYVVLGYTTLQLDRNYNRNFNELKRTKKEADRLGVKTCLLIRENCMPDCPFKTEHDIWQGEKVFRNLGKSYWDVAGDLSCNTWQSVGNDIGVTNPRTGTQIMVHSKDDWDEFANLVNVFKISGRLNTPDPNETTKFGYHFEMWKDQKLQDKHPHPSSNVFMAESFKDIYENNLAPFLMWFSFNVMNKDYPAITDIDEIKEKLVNHFWNDDEAKALCKTLKHCKNQCYTCHKCDDLFNTGKVDSILDISNKIS
tara:strand:+ start:1300 stop:2523 length:1224 start_codon:yes stop_codon:yes gene_type:complete